MLHWLRKTFLRFQGRLDLHCACRSGQIDRVRQLLDRGADINLRKALHPRGPAHAYNTPLHEAIEGLHLEVVELLLDRGADPNGVRKWGVSPLWLWLICASALQSKPKDLPTPKQLSIAACLIAHGARVGCMSKEAQYDFHEHLEECGWMHAFSLLLHTTACEQDFHTLQISTSQPRQERAAPRRL